MARSPDGHGSPARLFAKKKWSSSGETDIAGGARTDKADAKFESESPHQSALGQQLPFADVRAPSAYTLRAAQKRTFRVTSPPPIAALRKHYSIISSPRTTA